MEKDFAFLFYPGEYLRDTQCLSEAGQVAYDRIMCEHMRSICIAQQQLNFFTKRLTPEEKSELMLVLTKIEGGFQIDWVTNSITKRQAYSESRRKNGLTIKEKKSKYTSEAYAKHMVNVNINEIEIENTTKNENQKTENFLIPQMCDLWYSSFPLNTKHKLNDFEGMGKILQFMYSQQKFNIQSADEQIKILNTLQLIADQVNREPFWINKPIKSIANNIQEFYNNIKNPLQKEKNGKSNGFTREGVQAEFNKRYNSGEQA